MYHPSTPIHTAHKKALGIVRINGDYTLFLFRQKPFFSETLKEYFAEDRSD